MTQQQLIKQIEKKIQETQTLITNYKQQLANQENTLLTLKEELKQIELNIKENKQIK